MLRVKQFHGDDPLALASHFEIQQEWPDHIISLDRQKKNRQKLGGS